MNLSRSTPVQSIQLMVENLYVSVWRKRSIVLRDIVTRFMWFDDVLDAALVDHAQHVGWGSGRIFNLNSR